MLSRWAALGIDQARLVSGDDELYSVPGAEFGQQPGHVGLGGARSDIQRGGDLRVGHAQAHQPEHLAFAVGDPGELPGLAARTGLVGELPDQAAGDARCALSPIVYLPRRGNVRLRPLPASTTGLSRHSTCS
jgi:hypothetical protein